MGSFMSMGKLKLRKTLGTVEGIEYTSFNPKYTTVGVGKASGGIVYFNVKGCRVKTDMDTMAVIQKEVAHLGQVRVFTSDAEQLFDGAVPGPQIPWKGLTLQEYQLKDGTVGYIVVEGTPDA